MADLPGLIEGASEGKGLGLRFLRHVERTRVLAFLIDASTEDPNATLEMLEREIQTYGPALAEKPRVVVLSKADLVAPDDRAGWPAHVGLPQARLLSAHSGDGLRELLEDLWTRILAATQAETDNGEDDEDVG